LREEEDSARQRGASDYRGDVAETRRGRNPEDPEKNKNTERTEKQTNVGAAVGDCAPMRPGIGTVDARPARVLGVSPAAPLKLAAAHAAAPGELADRITQLEDEALVAAGVPHKERK
jgi:hypothetical protein